MVAFPRLDAFEVFGVEAHSLSSSSFSPCTSLLWVGVRLFLCMRLVSTMSSPLHAAIGSVIPLHAAGFDYVESAACGYRFGHRDDLVVLCGFQGMHYCSFDSSRIRAIWAQVLSAAMGAKAIKAGKGAKVIKGAGKSSKVIKGSKGGNGCKGRGKQTLKKPASSGEGHVMKRPAAAVGSLEERLNLQSNCKVSGYTHVGNIFVESSMLLSTGLSTQSQAGHSSE